LPPEARGKSRDAVAAQLILQSWLDEKSDAVRDLA
jgi:RNase H-fold protein (predicted Holliday junction resolvase)